MKKHIERIRGIMQKQAEARGLLDIEMIGLRLHRMQEELGEASRAYRDYCNCDLKDHDKIIERHAHYTEEAVDCVISALALFCASDFDMDCFERIFERKTNKWEANIESKKD